MGQLQSLKMSEGSAVEEYIKKARELKNRLSSMGDKLSDRNINQIVMNGLPRSYESTIQTLTHLDAEMTFDKLTASLFSESHRRMHRNQLLGDEEALAASHHRHAPARAPHPGYARGRWTPNFRGCGFPGKSHYGPPRPPPICFNCNKPGHLARDCRQPKNPYIYPDQSTLKNTGYANSAEIFDSQLDYAWYDPYYYSWDDMLWYLDSGATSHIASDPHKLDDQPSSSGVEISEIKTGGGESHHVRGNGTATVQTENGAIKLKSVKYVPSMRKNLISIGAIADSGLRVIFSSQDCWIISNEGNVLATGNRDPSNGLYRFKEQMTVLISEHGTQANHPSINSRTAHPIQSNFSSTILWHKRLGHLSYPSMHHLAKTGNVLGLPQLDSEHRICQCCLAGRQHRERFLRQSETRSAKPGQCVHTDLMGPMQQTSLGGS